MSNQNMGIEGVWDSTYGLLGRDVDESTIEKLLLSLEQCCGDSIEKSLLRTFIAYHFPCNATREIDIKQELILVLRRVPENLMAKLYLSHFFFDSKQFDDALRYLEEIRNSRFAEIAPAWQVQKVWEMDLASKIHVSGTVDPEQIVEFVRRIREKAAEDSPVPVELVNSLIVNREALIRTWTKQVFQDVVLELRSMIDEVAGEGVLRKEIDELMR